MEGGALFNPGFLGGSFLWWVGKLLSQRNAIIALSDAGAHVEFLCDAGFGIYFLQHWVNKTGTFSLENAVRKLT